MRNKTKYLSKILSLLIYISLFSLITGCATKRLPIPEGYNLVKTQEMKVYANRGWQKSAYEIKKGDFIKLTAEGKWNAGGGYVSADGSTFWTLFWGLIPPFQIFFLFNPKTFAKHHSLIGEFENEKRVKVGKEYTFNNEDGYYSGNMFFICNDGSESNNSGFLDVTMAIYRSQSFFPIKPSEKAHTVPSHHNRWALIVGLSQYGNSGKNGLSNLIFADDDAVAFKKSLLKIGWQEDHIKLLTDKDATKMKIEEALEGWLSKAGKDDVIVLYWSGHGYPDPDNPNKVYFACYDSDVSKPYSGWRMDKVMDVIKEKNARNVIVIADTCHAGKLITRGEKGFSVRPYVEGLKEKQNIPKGWIYMVSAEADRKAIENSKWSHGAFTYCLIKGLSGEADVNSDGKVSMLELKAFMGNTMPEETLRVLGKAKHPIILTNSSDKNIWNLSLEGRK